jgi:hypothetical protein
VNANPSDLPLELVGAAVLDRLARYAVVEVATTEMAGSRKEM